MLFSSQRIEMLLVFPPTWLPRHWRPKQQKICVTEAVQIHTDIPTLTHYVYREHNATSMERCKAGFVRENTTF